MSGLYERAMRTGSAILFGTAIIVFVIAVAAPFLPDGGGAEFMDLPSSVNPLAVFGALANALSAASWPFFGAAILWRIDRALPSIGAVGR